VDRFRAGARRRALGIFLALLVEGLLLLALLTLGPGKQAGEEESRIIVVNFKGDRPAETAPEADSADPEPRAQERPEPQPPTQAPPPSPAARPLPPPPAQPPPSRPSAVPMPAAPLPAAPRPPSAGNPNAGRPAGPARPLYGPPNPGGSSSPDTERVGTAPNGEPLYAASWHTRPRPDQLRGYLATATGPGWGLIACRTAPGFRVEDCVPLSEYPQGSQINRAVLAAAWEFKVRPPRIGGRSLVGSWVRIRIDYTIERR
jgi:protein TonB